MATIIITWTVGGGTNVINQSVKRSISGANSYTTIATVGPTVNTYTDTQAADNTLYQYQIVTNCSTGGPSVNLGANPEAIYIACGSTDISSSTQFTAQGTPYPEITWTIFNRLGTDTKTYSWVWKQGVTDQTYTYTVNTQNAVTGTFNSNQFTGAALSWSTTYTLEVTFNSINNIHNRKCFFNFTTPTQPACTSCTGQAISTSLSANEAFSSYTFSRGSWLLGYYDSSNGNNQVNTAAGSKSSGNPVPTTAGNTGGGTVCDQGFIQVTAGVPFQGTSPTPPNNWRTDVYVYVNSSLLGVVSSGFYPNGSDVTQTFTWTRTASDYVEVIWDSVFV